MGESYKDSPMVGVPGFEPGASWTRTKRDTKLRHTPMDTVRYYSDFKRNCQAENYRLPSIGSLPLQLLLESKSVDFTESPIADHSIVS